METEFYANEGRFLTIPMTHFVPVDDRYSVKRTTGYEYNRLIVRDEKRKGTWQDCIFRPDAPDKPKSVSHG